MRGKVHKYNDNVDTDVIIPARYLKELDPMKLAEHAMEGIDSDFVKKVKQGDFIVARKNFGCGSSREHAPMALRNAGIKAVLAISFARIFYRNAVDGGYLLPIEIDEKAYDRIQLGDELEITLAANKISNITRNDEYKMKPFQMIIQRIVDAGGIMKYKPEER